MSSTAPAAVATAPQTTPPPPLDKWCPKGLLDIIRGSPANPQLRGLIRKELHIIVPPTLFGEQATAGAIESFLTTNYLDSKAGREAAAAEIKRAKDEEQKNILLAQEARRGITRNADGTLTIASVTCVGEETGKALFVARFRASRTGVTVPANVVEQGPKAIADFLKAHVIDQEGDTDDYRYHGHDTPEHRAHRVVNLTEFNMNEGVLRLALS